MPRSALTSRPMPCLLASSRLLFKSSTSSSKNDLMISSNRLATVLAETTVLTVLKVSKNRLRTSDALKLIEALKRNSVAPLLQLEIEDNHIDEEVVAKLLAVVAGHALNPHNKSPLRLLNRHSSITELDDEDPDREYIELHSDPLLAEIDGKLKRTRRRPSCI